MDLLKGFISDDAFDLILRDLLGACGASSHLFLDVLPPDQGLKTALTDDMAARLQPNKLAYVEIVEFF